MRPLAVTLVLAVVSTASTAQPDRGHLATLTVDELKLTYLECDRRASQTLLGAAEAAQCSMAAEELMQRDFGGDFGRLLGWWRAQRRATEQRQLHSLLPVPNGRSGAIEGLDSAGTDSSLQP